MMSSGISGEQIAAIKRTIYLARRLQKDHPEIADLYRKGNYQPEIVNLLSLCKEYNVTEAIARSAVGVALRGYKDNSRESGFEGLLNELELSELFNQHQSQHAIDLYLEGRGVCSLTPEEKSKFGKIGGKIAGELAKKKGLGICGLSTEERRRIGHLAGQMGGKTVRDLKKGIFAYTPEQRVAKSKLYGSRAGKRAYELEVGIHALNSEGKRAASRLAIVAQGKVSWKEREITDTYCRLSEHEYAFMLSHSTEYQYKNGRYAGKPNLGLIASQLNEIYHNNKPIRNALKVQLALQYFKRTKKPI